MVPRFVVSFALLSGHLCSVRALTQPRVLRASGIAALLSAVACYPRLALWPDRPNHTGFLWIIMALKVNASEIHPPALILAGLLIGFLSVRFYLEGGVTLTCWSRLLLEARHGADWL